VGVGLLDPVVPIPPEPSPTRPRHRLRDLTVAFVVVAGVVGSASWWFLGGARLGTASFGEGTSARPGEWAHTGISLWANGGHVTLVSARAVDVHGDARIQFELLRAGPGDTGLITSASGGSLASLGYKPHDVHGADVGAREPNDPPVDLVMSMQSDGPGVTRVGAIEITYRSGPRTRHVRADVTVCDRVGTAVAEQASGCPS
jgi:hypothetical protein